MKTRFKFFGLVILAGLIYIFLGLPGIIWWIITGKKNFADIFAESIFEKMRELEKSFKVKP